MNIEEKMELIEESGFPLAFDGCHKIYFLEDEGRQTQAVEFGYDIFPSSELRRIWDESCGLRFVTRWGFDNDDFEHPWNIEQFEGEEEEEEEYYED